MFVRKDLGSYVGSRQEAAKRQHWVSVPRLLLVCTNCVLKTAVQMCGVLCDRYLVARGEKPKAVSVDTGF